MLVLLVVGSAFMWKGPIHAVGCLFDGRNGWLIEMPEGRRHLSEVRAVVRDATRGCVGVDVTYVYAGMEEDGYVITPGPRVWSGGDDVPVRVEAAAGPGVVACGEPLDPSATGAVEILGCSMDPPGSPTPP